jgi:hypothetical protein
MPQFHRFDSGGRLIAVNVRRVPRLPSSEQFDGVPTAAEAVDFLAVQFTLSPVAGEPAERMPVVGLIALGPGGAFE